MNIQQRIESVFYRNCLNCKVGFYCNFQGFPIDKLYPCYNNRNNFKKAINVTMH